MKRILFALLVLVGTSFAASDPCATADIAKRHAFFNITTATTTQLVAAPTLQAGSNQIFVCTAVVQLSSSTASTVLFEQGTGTNCGTGTAALTATYANATVPLMVNMGTYMGTFFTAGSGQALCAVTTVGTGPNIAIDLTFVIQ